MESFAGGLGGKGRQVGRGQSDKWKLHEIRSKNFEETNSKMMNYPRSLLENRVRPDLCGTYYY